MKYIDFGHYTHKRYKKPKKRILGLKVNTWISILIILIGLSFTSYRGYEVQQTGKALSELATTTQVEASEVRLPKKLAIPTPTPTLTPQQIIYSQKHGDIIIRIWNNESSDGKATDPTGINVKCAKKGFSNDFGFDPQDNYCFPTFEAAVIKVNQWFNKCLTYDTLGECLERYSGNSKLYINSFLNQ